MILTDTFIVENAELLIEQRGGKTIRRLRGIFGRCDEKNNNGRVYSKHLLEREVKRIAEAMVERRLLGELDHPYPRWKSCTGFSRRRRKDWYFFPRDGISFRASRRNEDCQ